MSELVKYKEVDKWLLGKEKSTRNIYVSGMLAYMEFTGLNPTQLIDEAELDREKKVRERGTPELRVKGFKEWLLTKYQQKTRGARDKPKKRRDKFGVSENLANMYCSAMKGFYRDNGFKLDVRLGKARKKDVNFKLIVRAPEITKLLSVATSLRDKAIIKFMYESTQGVSETCSLNYGDIKQYVENEHEVWQFHVIRKKTSTEYFTEIGEEAIDYLNLYFAERKRNGEVLTELSPVFVKEGIKKSTRQRITVNLIENMMKSLAIKSGLVTEEKMKLADINPARPHSLRAGGMSVLKLNGVPEKWVEFRCGHELGGNDTAYFLTRPEELRKLFRQHYNSLRIKGTTEIDSQKLSKLEEMLADSKITIHALQENGKLKVAELERLRKEIDKQRQALLDLSKWIENQQKADREALKDLQKWREEFMERHRGKTQQINEQKAKLIAEQMKIPLTEARELLRTGQADADLETKLVQHKKPIKYEVKETKE